MHSTEESDQTDLGDEVSRDLKDLLLNISQFWPRSARSDSQIKQILLCLADKDSNNLANKVGAGEREGRIYSKIVSDRWFNLSHGVGRSGNLTESQPKARGSSYLQKCANKLAFLALKVTLSHIKYCFITPVATGMSLLLCILTFKSLRPNAKYVIWTRADQKSALKAIITSGLTPLVIEGQLNSNEDLVTNLSAIDETVTQYGPENIACVLSTTSCFAPRGVDDIEGIGKICFKNDIPHLINNAYGLQSQVCCGRIDYALYNKECRVDLVVQSCDKNFLVPVGGAIIAGNKKDIIDKVKNMYAGRASMAPCLDMLITLLQLGRDGYKELLIKQKENFSYLSTKLNELAQKFDEKILGTKSNKISLAMTLNNFKPVSPNTSVTYIGSQLFMRNIFGARVNDGKKVLEIGNLKLEKFGCHHSNYPYTYINVSCAIGMTTDEIDTLIAKLDKILPKFKKICQ